MAQTIRAICKKRADFPHFQGHRIASRALTGYKFRITFLTNPHPVMSAKFYFYFFWYLRPLADREG
ncbi:conserved protein of unknown function [Burkholderia multivorans]